jgi:hypothetical protein
MAEFVEMGAIISTLSALRGPVRILVRRLGWAFDDGIGGRLDPLRWGLAAVKRHLPVRRNCQAANGTPRQRMIIQEGRRFLNTFGSTGNARERHGLFRCGAYAAARLVPIDPLCGYYKGDRLIRCVLVVTNLSIVCDSRAKSEVSFATRTPNISREINQIGQEGKRQL